LCENHTNIFLVKKRFVNLVDQLLVIQFGEIIWIMLENFSEIRVDTPVDKIIRQIRGLITSGQLNSGDRLPSERQLAERFGVGRSYVRDAIRKLEFYGIVKTMPQSGTIIAGLGITALEGLISDVLAIEESDFASLVETRVFLEVHSASLAAQRRTDDDIIALEKALKAYEAKLAVQNEAVEEDLMFHLKIAEASKNKVLKSLMLIIIPDIINNYASFKVCDNLTVSKALNEHRDILNFIVKKDIAGVENAMKEHLKEVLEFSVKRIIRS